jgi:hypothetical protein
MIQRGRTRYDISGRHNSNHGGAVRGNEPEIGRDEGVGMNYEKE